MKANWIVLLVTLGVFVAAPLALGEDTYWQNAGGGDWFDLNNWTFGPPLANDTAYIDNGGTARIDGGVTERAERVWVGYDNSGDMELISGTHKVDIAFVGGNSGALGEYEMAGGDMEASTVIVGFSGQGVFAQAGGTVDCNNTVGLGSQSGGEGTYTIAGDAFLEADDLTLATWGSANFVQNGGTVVIEDYLRFGWGDTGAGAYTLRGGNLNADAPGCITFVGIHGTGEFVQEGGTASIKSLYFGSDSDGSGTYTLHNGQLTSETIYVGYKGTGSFTQTGGTCSTDYLAVTTGNSYILSGGSLAFTGSAEVSGTFDLGSGDPSVGMGGIGDFATAAITNTGAPTLTVAADSLACFASDFDPYTEFASITNHGIIHQKGSAITIGPSTIVRGRGNIYDHVYVQGELSATNRHNGINIIEGIFVSDGGIAHLDSGEAVIENEISGMSDGELWADKIYVGKEGSGRFIQSGGLMEYGGPYTVGGELYVGFEAGSSGHYELSGDSVIRMVDVTVGRLGTGRFIQNGGTIHLAFSTGAALHVGGWSGGEGHYELNGGEIRGPRLFVNGGTFRQTGGSYNDFAGSSSDGVHVGTAEGVSGTYELLGGTITAGKISVGERGEGRFVQSGGTVAITRSALEIAIRQFGTGTYELSGDGTLTMPRMQMSIWGDGAFIQDGGSVEVLREMELAPWSGTTASALYRISAGSLTVAEMYIGSEALSSGTFDIAGASGDITISEQLTVKGTGVIRAVPGATIHMTGSHFENESTDPAALAGLENISFIFEGGPGQNDTFEVAGEDLGGDDPAGLADNFTIDTLQLGGSDVGVLQLVDLFDNQADGQTVGEALYVKNLIVGPGSSLDLNGLNLYYLAADLDPTGEIIGGMPTEIIPEPATLILMAGGLPLLLKRKRKSRWTSGALGGLAVLRRRRRLEATKLQSEDA